MNMRPTLRQMEYVVTVQQCASFGMAALRLRVSQPSLSNQIAAVEDELGIQLFERGRHGVRITPKGREFVDRARRILAEVQNLRSAMARTLPFDGLLRLGVLPSIGPYLLPQMVQTLHMEQPELRVIVREENTLNLDEGMRSGRFDAIISTPEDHPDTRQFILFRERLWAVLSHDHPLSRHAQIEADDLSSQRLLTLDSGHRLARIVYALASQNGGIVSTDYEGTSLDSILLMAATGAGVGIIPELFAKQQAIYRNEVIVLPLMVPDADRSIGLLYPGHITIDEGHLSLVQRLQKAALSYGMTTYGSEGE